MAVLSVFGAELNSAAVGMEMNSGSVDAGAAFSISSAIKHSGLYSLRVNGLDSTVPARAQLRVANTASLGPFFTSAFFRFTTGPSAANRIQRYDGASVPMWTELNADGTLRVGDEDGLIATSTTALSTGTWYQLICEFNGTGAGATDVVRVHLYDDSGTLLEIIGATNRDVAATVATFSFGGNIFGEAQTQGDWYWDDVICCDSTGASMNSVASLVGVRLVCLRPNGEGDADVLVSRGGADSGSNFGQVDEETPNDATDYLSLTGTTSEFFGDTQDAPAAIGASDAIPFVALGGRIAAATAAATNWFPSIKTQAGGTEVNGTSTTYAVTAWNTHDDAAGTSQYKLVQYTDPQAGGAWTKTLVNAMQIGAKGTDGNPDLWITALWAYVGYIPSGAAPQTLTPSAVTAAWATTTPVISKGPLTLAPSAVTAAWATFSPVIIKGTRTIQPDAVAAAFSIQTPSVVTDAGQNITPASVAAAFSVATPALIRGALVMTPTPVTAAFTIQNPLLIRGPVTLTPAAITAQWVVFTPTVLRGPILITPAAAQAAFGVFAPTLIVGPRVLTPEPVFGTFLVLTPTIEGGEQQEVTFDLAWWNRNRGWWWSK